jgi:hypothetical protein
MVSIPEKRTASLRLHLGAARLAALQIDAILAKNQRISLQIQRREAAMKVKKGDVLVCSGPDCDLELTVTQVCRGQTCHQDQECDITVSCGGSPLRRKDSSERMNA